MGTLSRSSPRFCSALIPMHSSITLSALSYPMLLFFFSFTEFVYIMTALFWNQMSWWPKFYYFHFLLFSFSLVILTCQRGNCEAKTKVQVFILFVFWGVGCCVGVLRLPSIILGTYSGDTLLWDNRRILGKPILLAIIVLARQAQPTHDSDILRSTR